jgi:4-aminobutyrate aminotransferase-like enzyme
MSSAPRASTLELLRHYESQNITFMEPDGSWPIVWEKARGGYVWDEQGKRYLDLTAAFGVAACGHANPRVIAAGKKQMSRLPHAMGDVHPHRLKAELARELSRITFERWPSRGKAAGAGRTGKTIFCNSGFEAVEAGLKTARLATGKPGVVVFKKAYHGLGYGALSATHREHFRGPFLDQLRGFGKFVPFPSAGSHTEPHVGLEAVETQIRRHLAGGNIGAVLVEPVQARGGINVPDPGFLPMLRRLCDAFGVLLIVDEIYTGFGRTGRWFACEHSDVVPDVICLGKALTGGFPLSACVGRAELMDAAWPRSTGEAIHTSTFLGNPVGCAMALANIAEIENRALVTRAAQTGEFLADALSDVVKGLTPSLRGAARGVGLMAGLELSLPDGAPGTAQALNCIKKLLHRGFILLPEGEDANVISFTPPLTISQRQLASAIDALALALSDAR